MDLASLLELADNQNGVRILSVDPVDEYENDLDLEHGNIKTYEVTYVKRIQIRQ